MGWGVDAVVVYGADGHLVRKLALTDFLPDYYVEALPRSASSIWWSGDHQLSDDGETLTLQIVVPDDGSIADEHRYVLRKIRLADGAVSEDSSADWKNALADARKQADALRSAEEEARRFRTEPLLGPNPPTEPGWFNYMSEAFFRLDPDWQEGSADQTVLRSPIADDYRLSLGWLKDSLASKDALGSTVMIATLAPPEHLLSVMEGILRKSRSGKFTGMRFYVVIPIAFQDRLAAMFEGSGAHVICVDPTAPIPLPPERLEWRQKQWDGSF